LKVEIKHGTDSRESYALYDGMTNALFTPGEATRARKLVFGWTADPGYSVEDRFWEGAEFTWYMPAARTMLAPTKDWTLNEEGTHYVATGRECIYNIASYYNAGLRDNTIKCIVKISCQTENGEPAEGQLEGTITLGFSTFGASGTDYTIIFSESED
jgi:hypothetical protein